MGIQSKNKQTVARGGLDSSDRVLIGLQHSFALDLLRRQ